MLPREHYLKQPFQDREHFPAGFDHSRRLSGIQARLIRKHGALIQALCQGEVINPTAEDRHLLKVITKQAAPKNPVEQAWLKYLAIVQEEAAGLRKSA